jgi:hypothetical protein
MGSFFAYKDIKKSSWSDPAAAAATTYRTGTNI